MKTKLILALPLVAIFAIPGSASQPDATDAVGPQVRLRAMQVQLGVAVDPHQAAGFSISLPTGYTTFDLEADPFAS